MSSKEIKKENLLSNGWKQKNIRLSSEYIRTCNHIRNIFEKYENKRKSIEALTIFDTIINYSLDRIKTDDRFEGVVELKEFKGSRKGKGMLVKDDTWERFLNTYKIEKPKYASAEITLTKGKFMEIIIYIWCLDNLGEKQGNYDIEYQEELTNELKSYLEKMLDKKLKSIDNKLKNIEEILKRLSI